MHILALPKNQLSLRSKVIYIILSAIVLLYIIIRSAILPVTIDEAGTFFYYINTDNFIPFTQDYHWTANNHMLNSALTWLSIKLFGLSPFTLRLASILFFLIYTYYIYLFSEKLNNTHLKWLFRMFFLTLCGFVEFFSISRGYSISLACLMGALYHLYEFFYNKEVKDNLNALALIAFATIANLNSILLFGMMLITSILFFVIHFKKFNTAAKIKMIFLFTTSSVFIYFIKKILDELKNRKELMHGSDIDNLSEMFRSMATSIYYKAHEDIIFYIIILTIFFTVSAWLFVVYKEKQIFTFYNVGLFFIGNLLMVYFLKKIMSINLPKDRTTIQLFFLLMLYFFTTVNQLNKYLPKFSRTLYMIPLVFIFYSFKNVNINHSNFGFYSFIPHQFYNYIKNNSTENTIVSSFENSEMIWGIHNVIKNNTIVLQQTGFPRIDCEYIISTEKEEKNTMFKKYPHSHLFHLIPIENSTPGYYLYKRNKPVIKKEWLYIKKYSKINSNQEYFNLCDTITAIETDINITSEFKIKCNDHNIFSWYVVDISDTLNNNLVYEFIALDRLKRNFNTPQQLYIPFNFNKLTHKTLRIKVYIWNIKKNTIQLENQKVIINKNIL